MTVVFWVTTALLFYTYLAYHLILVVAVRLKEVFGKNPDTPQKDFGEPDTPLVSIIIAAYQEEKTIQRRIENLLSLDYPKDKLEIIVASDGSTDRTVEIARQFENEGIKVLDFKENRGRAAVHNSAAKIAKGEIFIFTDAETEFQNDFLKAIVRMFKNPKLGAGAGELIIKARNTPIGETGIFYSGIERKQRDYEYRLGILPFASGACFCIRKELWEDIPAHSDIDNVLPLRVIEKDFSVFYCKDAVAFDYAVSERRQFFRARYRTALRSMTDILSEVPRLAKKRKFGVLFALFSHRLLRWWGSLLLPVIFFSNLSLLDKGFLYWGIFACQLGLNGLALVGYLQDRFGFPRIFSRIPGASYSFLLSNIAFVWAVINYLLGKKITAYRR
jgi:cellulose synthase/poly-beta-1,6-N-acetylglucosamine synthase-like glycosyltransferase